MCSAIGGKLLRGCLMAGDIWLWQEPLHSVVFAFCGNIRGKTFDCCCPLVGQSFSVAQGHCSCCPGGGQPSYRGQFVCCLGAISGRVTGGQLLSLLWLRVATFVQLVRDSCPRRGQVQTMGIVSAAFRLVGLVCLQCRLQIGCSGNIRSVPSSDSVGSFSVPSSDSVGLVAVPSSDWFSRL